MLLRQVEVIYKDIEYYVHTQRPPESRYIFISDCRSLCQRPYLSLHIILEDKHVIVCNSKMCSLNLTTHFEPTELGVGTGSVKPVRDVRCTRRHRNSKRNSISTGYNFIDHIYRYQTRSNYRFDLIAVARTCYYLLVPAILYNFIHTTIITVIPAPTEQTPNQPPPETYNFFLCWLSFFFFFYF